jgi:uncharacterized protein (DUF2141 family)
MYLKNFLLKKSTYIFHLNYLSSLILLFFLNSCAQVGQLSGGIKDEIPPKVVVKRSSPNFQTNFKNQPILLTFDEWVKLEDAASQVVVSPPLAARPTVTLSGKTVRFEFGKNEKLRENATYTINFGAAVKDITESNAAKDLRFVFSTGAQLDSLKFECKIIDAQTATPQENILVMLYDEFADSVVRKNRPFYFAKTNKDGIATISNVREGRFKAFALKDADGNYKFNNPDSELIAFPDSLVRVSAVPAAPLSTRLFAPQKKLRVTSKDDSRYGLLRLNFNRTPNIDEVNIRTFMNGKIIFSERQKDSLLIWFEPAENPELLLALDTVQTDTIKIKHRNKNDFLKKAKLENRRATGLTFPQPPHRPFEMILNHPLSNLDTSRILLTDTAQKRVPYRAKIDGRRIAFDVPNWQPTVTYQLQVLPKALTDIFYLNNQDTILHTFKVLSKKDFGDIILKINDLDSNKKYIIELRNGGGNVLASFKTAAKATKFSTQINTLSPEQVTLVIIEDLNGNGFWDTGDYDLHRQPEPFFKKNIEQAIRANWEIEVEYSLKDW